jgi:hypothetical protein
MWRFVNTATGETFVSETQHAVMNLSTLRYRAQDVSLIDSAR